MSFAEGRAYVATMTGRPLSTAATTRVIEEVTQRMGRRPDQVVGPGIRLRWVNDEGVFAFKPKAYVDEAGNLTWRVGYSFHLDDTLNLIEDAAFTEDVFDDEKRSNIPYLWNLRVCEPHAWVAPRVPTNPSWHKFVINLGRTLGELPSILAVLPDGWAPKSITISNPSQKVFSATATRDGLVMSTKVPAGAPEAHGATSMMFAFDTARAVEVGPLLASTVTSNFTHGFGLENVVLSTDWGRENFIFGNEQPVFGPERLDTDIDPHEKPAIPELREIATWVGENAGAHLPHFDAGSAELPVEKTAASKGGRRGLLRR